MNWQDLFKMQHLHVHARQLEPGGDHFAFQDWVLGGMTEEQLRLIPAEGQNSVVWLLWHIARCEDVALGNVLSRRGQVLDDSWAAKLGIGRRDIGTGMTAAEVRDLSQRIDLQALLDYRLAVARQTVEIVDEMEENWLASLMSDEDLAALEELGAFGEHAGWMPDFWRTKPRAWFLWLPTGHCYQHLGEAVTVRSLGGMPL